MNTAALDRFLRFVGIGLIATGLQYAVLVVGVERLGLTPVIGSTLGGLARSVRHPLATGKADLPTSPPIE